LAKQLVCIGKVTVNILQFDASLISN